MRFLTIFLGAVVFLSASPAAALLILDSASGVPSNTAGSTVNDDFYQMHRFEITASTQLATVGGVFGNQVEVFAAVVALTSDSDLPDSLDLTGSDVLATTILSTVSSPGLSTTPLSLAVNPGWYALVFGTGAFGAPSLSGSTFMSTHPTDLEPSQFVTTLRQASHPSGEGVFVQLSPGRFYVTAIPEPSSAALLGLSLAVLGLRGAPQRRVRRLGGGRRP